MFLRVQSDLKRRNGFRLALQLNSEDTAMSKFYNKDKIFSTYHKDGIITTPFDRKIPSDDFHALNYQFRVQLQMCV